MTPCGFTTAFGLRCSYAGIAWGPFGRCWFHWTVEDPATARPVADLTPERAGSNGHAWISAARLFPATAVDVAREKALAGIRWVVQVDEDLVLEGVT